MKSDYLHFPESETVGVSSAVAIIAPGPESKRSQAQADATHVQQLLSEWNAHRCGTQRVAQLTLKYEASIIEDLVRFSQKAPRSWGLDDIRQWTSDLILRRKVLRATLRVDLQAVRRFLCYGSELAILPVEYGEISCGHFDPLDNMAVRFSDPSARPRP